MPPLSTVQAAGQGRVRNHRIGLPAAMENWVWERILRLGKAKLKCGKEFQNKWGEADFGRRGQCRL